MRSDPSELSVKTDCLAKTECPVWAPPLLAIQFLTRVPVPGVSRLSQADARVGLSRAVAWFPLVGALIGALTAATMLLVEHFWPRLIAVMAALIIEAWVTGAFHEDAVADFCDGVGGGRDPTHVRQIMKDSRIGTFGTLGLALAVALRAALMYSLDAAWAAMTIIAAATFGRLLAVIVMTTTPPAPSAGGLAKDVTAVIRSRDVALACLTSLAGLSPFGLRAPLALISALFAALVFAIWFRALLMRRVGGITGDCLGFTAYAGQLVLLMAATAS